MQLLTLSSYICNLVISSPDKLNLPTSWQTMSGRGKRAKGNCERGDRKNTRGQGGLKRDGAVKANKDQSSSGGMHDVCGTLQDADEYQIAQVISPV
jgi:hypothetical protein